MDLRHHRRALVNGALVSAVRLQSYNSCAPTEYCFVRDEYSL